MDKRLEYYNQASLLSSRLLRIRYRASNVLQICSLQEGIWKQRDVSVENVMVETTGSETLTLYYSSMLLLKTSITPQSFCSSHRTMNNKQSTLFTMALRSRMNIVTGFFSLTNTVQPNSQCQSPTALAISKQQGKSRRNPHGKPVLSGCKQSPRNLDATIAAVVRFSSSLPSPSSLNQHRDGII